MTPTLPFAFVALALAIPVVAAYLHRRRRLDKKMPSVILLRVIAGASRPTRRAWSRPRHLVSLALVLAALIGLVLALADLRDEHDKPRDFVVVLDTSASMAATDGSTRLEHAIEAVGEAIESLHPGDRVALVTTGAQTLVRIGLTEDHVKVFELAQTAEAGGTSQGAARAIRLADALCSAGREGSIVLVSDRVGVDVPTTTCPLEHVSVGRDGPNAGIVALSVREADALGLSEVHVGVASRLGRDQPLELTLKVDDAVIDVVSIDVPASGDVEKLHRVPLPPGERVTAQIAHAREDVLALDDIASVARHGGQRISVLLVAQTRLSFTAEALRLHPRVDLRVVGPRDTIGTDEHFDLVVLEADYQAGPIPLAPKLVALGTTASKLGVATRADVETPEILRWSFDHPLFRFVDLQGLDVPKTQTLAPSTEQTSLIDTEQGSLALAGKWDGREMVYVGFAPHHSDLVLRVGFVNFVANLVEWAAPALPEQDDARSGVLSAIETNIAPPGALPGAASTRFAASTLGGAPLWTYLAIAAFGALCIEWLLPAFVGAIARLRRRKATKAVPS
jgi:hypothetical protein